MEKGDLQNSASDKAIDVCLISKPKLSLNSHINIWNKQVDILVANRSRLVRDFGIRMHFRKNLPEKNYDVIIVLSRFFAGMQKHEKIAILKKLKSRTSSLLWFSERDSAGFTEFEVLPYVDRYLCKHIYRDMEIYNHKLYYNRKYVDFYAKKFNLTLEEFEVNEPLSDYSGHEHKIGLWWNIAYNNAGMVPRWKWLLNTYFLQSDYPFEEPRIFGSDHYKDFQLHAIFVTKDQRGHINYHRQFALEKIRTLKGIKMPEIHKRVPESVYFDLVKRSKCVFSPFGWGEICYRDFVAFLAGSCLIKPTVEDILTWPQVLAENETYVPIKWDLSDLEEKLSFYLENTEVRERIAFKGYETYMNIWSKQGIHDLLSHFSNIVFNREPQIIPVNT